MILSDGVLVKSPTTIWEGNTTTYPGWNQILTGQYWSSYADIYRQQVWVNAAINKLALGTARLPLKVYERDELNRPQVPDHPYSKLLNAPNPKMSRFAFWQWVSSTFDIYGEAFLVKVRDRGGRPVQLWPLHPQCMRPVDEKNGETVWEFQNGTVRIEGIRQSDLVHPRTYNPETTKRGLSRLEPLRRTLEFEDAAQRAQSSFWRKGARPAFVLTHENNLSQPAAERIKVRFDDIAAGADKTGTTVVLEEGMKPHPLTVNNEDAQYIDSRKLNREEVCGAYDIPPPALHILDRATFSNITEQMRSLYRDTHAPRLQLFEGCLETELRGSVRPGASDPDFSDDVYAEFLLDEVLRGDFEARSAAYQAADWMTVAEKRKAENLPYIEGTDRILVNAAVIPLDEVDNGPAMQNLRSVLGRVSRIKTLDQIRSDALVEGLNEHTAAAVRDALTASIEHGETVPQFRDRLKALGGPR
jgi:HK97 family phage portal protein